MSYPISITTLRKELYKVAKLVAESGVQVTVATNAGNFMILSEAEYHGIIETLYLSSDPSIKQSIIEGVNTPLEDTIHEDKIKW